MLTYLTIQLYQIYLKLRNSFPYKMSHLFVIFSLGEDLKGLKALLQTTIMEASKVPIPPLWKRQ